MTRETDMGLFSTSRELEVYLPPDMDKYPLSSQYLVKYEITPRFFGSKKEEWRMRSVLPVLGEMVLGSRAAELLITECGYRQVK